MIENTGLTINRPKSIALGMSGGVDSSLCAHLLTEQGYDVTGVYLECWKAPGCRSEQDRKDALKVALELDIPFQVLDFKQAYRDRVVEYFFEEYQAGRTPNPDVVCNREIKFGLFYDWAMEQGFDAVATGHYAALAANDAGTPQLVVPKDDYKDQTYFLWQLRPKQLRHSVFPLADLTKDEVRAAAEDRGIHVADKDDSVGICFIGDIDVHAFLEERLGKNPGVVVDTDGNAIGSHEGLWFYTIGQRHGFKIDPVSVVQNAAGEKVSKHNIPPFYVIDKDAENNQLVVGFGEETLRDSFSLRKMNWLVESKPTKQTLESGELYVRIRHTGSLMPVEVEWRRKEADQLTLRLQEAIRGIAAGQSGVLYLRKDVTTVCLGGGVID